MRLFALEGNIGCGKSTFLKILEAHFPKIQILHEPLAEWQNVGAKGINLLEMYYKDPKRWGLTFLNYAVFTRIKKWKQAENLSPQSIKITERSVLADRHVFSQLMKELQYITEEEFLVFKEMHSGFCKMFGDQKPCIIYLKCDPKVCHQRTMARKRPEEAEIPIQYLERIHKNHEAWITKELEHNDVLVIDTSEQFARDAQRIQSMVAKMQNFIGDKL